MIDQPHCFSACGEEEPEAEQNHSPHGLGAKRKRKEQDPPVPFKNTPPVTQSVL